MSAAGVLDLLNDTFALDKFPCNVLVSIKEGGLTEGNGELGAVGVRPFRITMESLKVNLSRKSLKVCKKVETRKVKDARIYRVYKKKSLE